jgi:lysine 2,3-aminomutase
MPSPRYLNSIDEVNDLENLERKKLKKVEEKFAFRANEYYLSLIDWENPQDPIRKIIIPDIEELSNWGLLDASVESNYSFVPGIQHKYEKTALILVSDQCGGFCRFCFRKRLFLENNREVIRDLSEAIEYLQKNQDITNILLSGGDPLNLSTPEFENILKKIREIDHIRIIRIGSKMPAYNPYRIIDDPALPELIRKYSTDDKKIYIMTQFNHPRELTDVAIRGLNILQHAGAILANQTPILRGVNDDPETLSKLLRNLSFIGNAPYYVFQCRPTIGNRHFTVPIEEGYRIFECAKAYCSGLAKRPRFVMSHEFGKIEIVGVDEEHVYLKFHQAVVSKNIGKILVFKKNPEAYWFEDYTEQVSESKIL